jgi:predicted transcriptional regulator
VTVYKLGDIYYGARSNEFGYANYEMIPSPQFVLNPLTATLNTFSVELGLNEQQKQQILPFLQDELKQLGALKKNTSLKPLEKIEQLKQIGGAIDAKIMPILDPTQQKKFREMREEKRREMIEQMGSQAIQKAEAKVKQAM